MQGLRQPQAEGDMLCEHIVRAMSCPTGGFKVSRLPFVECVSQDPGSRSLSLQLGRRGRVAEYLAMDKPGEHLTSGGLVSEKKKWGVHNTFNAYLSYAIHGITGQVSHFSAAGTGAPPC